MLALARARELDASCALLGAERPEIWGLPDGGLADRKEGLRKSRSAMRKSGADVVLALGADGAYGHPDHLTVHEWALRAWETIEEPPILLLAAFPHGLFLPQYEKCVASGIMGNPPRLGRSEIGLATADIQVDIGPFAETKRRAIGAHSTQLPGGEPEAMFPPGIVAALMAEERYTVATGETGPPLEEVGARLRELSPMFERC
jgi:N-acetyl-1-D-myo-inositol-2-amino-2-deoxy-alpha-D-glucopyranoside deacetylase